MSVNGNKKKAEQLGMSPGTAAGRLRKNIMFHLLVKLGENRCHQCGDEIEELRQLSIEHKVPWLDSEEPVRLFFDLDNVAFSHLSCNAGTARQPNKKYDTRSEQIAAKRKRYRQKKGPEHMKRIRRAKYERTGT